MARSLLVLLVAASCCQSAQAGVIYLESGGQTVGEGELFSRRTANGAGQEWTVQNSGIANFRGDGFVQALPDGVLGGTPTEPPSIEYDILIANPGNYQLFLRWSAVDGGSDSIYADIIQLKDGSGNSIADWYEFAGGPVGDFAAAGWDAGAGFEANNAGGSPVGSALFTLGTGLHTLRISMREDGAALDAWALQLASLDAPTGNGPATSEILSTVPEPSTMSILVVGATGLLGYRRVRRKRK